VRLIPRNSQALISNFLRTRLKNDFLRGHLFFHVEENEQFGIEYKGLPTLG